MKKVVVITIAVVVVGMLSVGAYAHYQDYQNNRRGGRMMSNDQTGMYGQQGRMGGPRGGMMMSNDQTGMYGQQGNMGGRRGRMMMSNDQTGMYGQQGKMGGRRGGMTMSGGRGQMQNRGPQGNWNANTATCPYGATAPTNTMRQGWRNAPNTDQATQMITEEKAKEAAQAYLDKYLSSYTIDKVEKDSWRPMFFVTLKGDNDALQQMTIHAFSGQVMHVSPQTAE